MTEHEDLIEELRLAFAAAAPVSIFYPSSFIRRAIARHQLRKLDRANDRMDISRSEWRSAGQISDPRPTAPFWSTTSDAPVPITREIIERAFEDTIRRDHGRRHTDERTYE